jgi:hypothetical protein
MEINRGNPILEIVSTLFAKAPGRAQTIAPTSTSNVGGQNQSERGPKERERNWNAPASNNPQAPAMIRGAVRNARKYGGLALITTILERCLLPNASRLSCGRTAR